LGVFFLKGLIHLSPFAVAGAPNGKYVICTKPLSAHTFGGQIEYFASLFDRQQADTPAGIIGISFKDLYAEPRGKPGEKLLDDGQRAAASLWYACWGIRDALNAAVGSAAAPADRKKQVDAMQRLFVNHLTNAARRQTIMTAIRNDPAYANAFDNNGKPKAPGLAETEALYMQTDALSMLFSAIGDAMHEQNRWIIGRALHTSHPGKSLDIEIGSFTRPYTY
jgi:hypothetical protein